jgi:hypothetical protein
MKRAAGVNALECASQVETQEPEPPQPVTVIVEDPPLPPPVTVPKPKPKPKKRRGKSLTVALEEKMVGAIKAQYGDGVVTKRWGVKERTLAKKLTESYTLEMTETVILKFVAEWPNMMRQSRGRLYGLPTINFLWAAQDRFFGAEQIGQNVAVNPANIDEYQGTPTNEDDDW